MTYGIVIGILMLALLATLIAVVAEKPAPREEPDTEPEIAPVAAPPAVTPMAMEPAPFDTPVAYAAMTSAEVAFEVDEPPVADEADSATLVSEVQDATQPAEQIVEVENTAPEFYAASQGSDLESAEDTARPAVEITTAELFLDPASAEPAVEFEAAPFDLEIDDPQNWRFDPDTGEPITSTNAMESASAAELQPEPVGDKQSVIEPFESSANAVANGQLEEEPAPDESGTSESTEGTDSDPGTIRI